MGYYGKLEYKLKAKDLRKQGLSYNEILNKIPVSKSTISHWCRDIVLTREQITHLYQNKLTGSIKGSIIGAKKQQETRIIKTEKIHNESLKELGTITNRDKFIAGIAFYSAEGTKRDGKCVFANADPNLIEFMMHWFRTFMCVPENKFRCSIWIHDNLHELGAKKYWSNLTKIPLNQFYKSYISENKINSNKIRKNIHQNGVVSIRVLDVNIHRKIMGLIAGLFINT
jgi:hypothetical protein